MVDCHGSQCGFCTPGFVMALYAYCKSSEPVPLTDAIAGNLCRCTGYRPILEAGERARRLADPKAEAAEDGARRARLAALPRETTQLGGFFNPLTVDELAGFLAAHPQAAILAGGTDAGLWITKQHRDLHEVAYVGRVSELKDLRDNALELEIGAAVTYAEAFDALAGLHPDIGELLRRLGAVQVRATGTLAGNIANGSPIGDSMPVLLALNSTLVLQRGRQSREVGLEDFYTGYRQNVLQPGEFIRAVRVPKLQPGARFAMAPRRASASAAWRRRQRARARRKPPTRRASRRRARRSSRTSSRSATSGPRPGTGLPRRRTCCASSMRGWGRAPCSS
jgi:xanthine dehydrogenase small subunit